MTVETPRYVPEFRVEIDGRRIPAALRASVSSVSHQSGLEGADRVELTLVNENLRWLDDPLLALDNKLVLSLGYAPGPLRQVFYGEIVSHSASFPSGGAPSLTIAAQDRIRHLQRGTKARWFALPTESSYTFIPDPIVASLVSLENGFVPFIDPVGAAIAVLVGGLSAVFALLEDGSLQRLIRKQEGMSDYDFLRLIAKENGWEMLVNHDGDLAGYQLQFMSPLWRMDPDVTLRYGQSLIEFTPRITDVGQIAAVSVRLWQSDTKLEFTVTVSWDWDRQALDVSISPSYGLQAAVAAVSAAGEGEPSCERPQIPRPEPRSAEAPRLPDEGANEEGGSNGAGGARVTVVDEPVTLASAPRKVMSKLLPKINERLTGSGSTIGDPRIQAGSVLRLEGVGRQFGGPYRVTSATHTVDSSGYRTSFEVRKEIWFGSIPEPRQGEGPFTIQGQRIG